MPDQTPLAPLDIIANRLYVAVVQPDTVWWDDLTPEMQDAWRRGAEAAEHYRPLIASRAVDAVERLLTEQALNTPLNREALVSAVRAAAYREDSAATAPALAGRTPMTDQTPLDKFDIAGMSRSEQEGLAQPAPCSRCGCSCICHSTEADPEWPGPCAGCCEPGDNCDCGRRLYRDLLPPAPLDELTEYGFCGSLAWTVEKWGRVTHKHSCPNRTDPWCQSHPTECIQPAPLDERQRIERNARLQDALDALTGDPFTSPHIWRNKARSGAVAIRAILARAYREDSE